MKYYQLGDKTPSGQTVYAIIAPSEDDPAWYLEGTGGRVACSKAGLAHILEDGIAHWPDVMAQPETEKILKAAEYAGSLLIALTDREYRKNLGR